MSLVLEIIKAPPEHHIIRRSAYFDEKGGDIGRSPEAMWCLEDHTRQISKLHAKITFVSGQYYITDTSSNGTFFNQPDKRLTPHVPMSLIKGSVIHIGMYEIVVNSIGNSLVDDNMTNINDCNFIPDDMFSDSTTSDVLSILKVDRHESSDIMTILDTNIKMKENEILPELDVILGLGENDNETDNIVTPESLSMHIQLDDINPETKNTSLSNDKIVDILSTKLNIDIKDKTTAEQEYLISNLADIINTVLTKVHEISKNMARINHVLGSVSEVDYSSLLSSQMIMSDSNQELSSILNNFLDALVLQQQGLLAAYEHSFSDLAKDFSPDALYADFENTGKLNRKFCNKDTQAWVAYKQKFAYLNNHTQGKEVLSESFRKQYNKGLTQ